MSINPPRTLLPHSAKLPDGTLILVAEAGPVWNVQHYPNGLAEVLSVHLKYDHACKWLDGYVAAKGTGA